MAETKREEQPNLSGWRKALVAIPKGLLWGMGILVVLLLVLFIASFFLDEPLRKSTETKLNQHLPDYTIRLPELHFQLIGLSTTLKGLTITRKPIRPHRSPISPTCGPASTGVRSSRASWLGSWK